jgi:hypothetical protein
MPKPQLRARARIRLTRARGVVLLASVCALALVAAAFALTGPGHASAAAAPAAAQAGGAGHGASSSPSTADASSTGSAAASSPSAPATEDPDQKLSAALSSLVSADDGHVSVAVENLATGTTVSDNVSDDYVTASIVKLDILETLLYQDQQSGSSPSSAETGDITAMIENSDNDAALDLFDDEGGAPAITAANKVFGLTDTDVDADAFGDTTTTVTDQIILLRQAMTSDSVLTSANRSYIQNLMANVESDQRWGVSAAADDASSSGTDYLLKNGWLPRSATNLWEINSIGEVEHDGTEYLVAVLSSDNESMDSGVDVVQNAAKAAVDSQ